MSLAGTRIVVSAGPTYEDIDPARFIGNRSSGKMGFALAAEAARRGAEVLLIAGPVHLPTPERLRRVDVFVVGLRQRALRDVEGIRVDERRPHLRVEFAGLAAIGEVVAELGLGRLVRFAAPGAALRVVRVRVRPARLGVATCRAGCARGVEIGHRHGDLAAVGEVANFS